MLKSSLARTRPIESLFIIRRPFCVNTGGLPWPARPPLVHGVTRRGLQSAPHERRRAAEVPDSPEDCRKHFPLPERRKRFLSTDGLKKCCSHPFLLKQAERFSVNTHKHTQIRSTGNLANFLPSSPKCSTSLSINVLDFTERANRTPLQLNCLFVGRLSPH